MRDSAEAVSGRGATRLGLIAVGAFLAVCGVRAFFLSTGDGDEPLWLEWASFLAYWLLVGTAFWLNLVGARRKWLVALVYSGLLVPVIMVSLAT
jgi:hypothetical protein